MSWIRDFWNDEFGALLSAEAAAVGTIAVIGATTGLSVATKAINAELGEVAQAIRSLDQSYAFTGQSSHGGKVFTAGSSYTQPPVAQALEEIRNDIQGAGKGDAPKPTETPKKKKKKERADDDEQTQADFPRVPGETESALEAPAVEANVADKVDVQLIAPEEPGV